MSQDTVSCVVCQKSYPLPEPEDLGRDGRHLFTCSDPCQEKFRQEGGISRRKKKEAK